MMNESTKNQKLNKSALEPYIESLKLSSNLLKDITNRVSQFITTLSTVTDPKDTPMIKKELKNIMNPLILTSAIKDNKLILDSAINLDSEFELWKKEFNKEDEVMVGFDLLTKSSSTQVIPKADPLKSCDLCNNPCNAYECYRMNCKHILDKNCFEK